MVPIGAVDAGSFISQCHENLAVHLKGDVRGQFIKMKKPRIRRIVARLQLAAANPGMIKNHQNLILGMIARRKDAKQLGDGNLQIGFFLSFPNGALLGTFIPFDKSRRQTPISSTGFIFAAHEQDSPVSHDDNAGRGYRIAVEDEVTRAANLASAAFQNPVGELPATLWAKSEVR